MRLAEEAIAVVGHLQHLRQRLGAIARLHGGREHDEVRLDLNRRATERIRALDDQLAVLLIDARDAAAEVDGALLLDGTAHKLVVILAARANIHVEDVGLAVMHLVLVEHRVLGRVHAADLRAVAHSMRRVARAGAGDEDDGLRHFAVRGPARLAAGRTRGAKQALELEAVDHVGVAPAAILAVMGSGHQVVPRGHDDGAHGLREDLILLLKVHGAGRAHLLADAALAILEIAAVRAVDDRHVRHRLRERHKDGWPPAEAHIELAGDPRGFRLSQRALRLALATARA